MNAKATRRRPGAERVPPGKGGAGRVPPGSGGARRIPPGKGGARPFPPGKGGARRVPPGSGGAQRSAAGWAGGVLLGLLLGLLLPEAPGLIIGLPGWSGSGGGEARAEDAAAGWEVEVEGRRLDSRPQGRQDLHTVLASLSREISLSRRRRQILERRITHVRKRVRKVLYALNGLKRRQARARRRLHQAVLRLHRISRQSLGGAYLSFINSPYFLKHGRYAALAHKKDLALLEKYTKLRTLIETTGFRRRDALNTLQELEASLQSERSALHTRMGNLRTVLASFRGNGLLRDRRTALLREQALRVQDLLLRLEASLPPFSPSATPRWSRPVSDGRVVRRFGDARLHQHEEPLAGGVLLSSRRNLPARAIRAGVVALVAPFYGNGTMVALYHGDGLLSIYGHLEQVPVEAGQTVAAGSVLGHIAYQPLHNAHWLYLGLRQNGVPRHPPRF